MQRADFRHNALALALSLALIAPSPALAQSATTEANGQTTQQPPPANPSPSSAKPETLQKVTVLGSMIPRSQVEGAAPVQVVTGAQIKAQGYTTLYQFMNSLPQSTGASDFGSNPTTWGSTAVNARPIDLRGLGPQYTLLLIDGHRVVDYPQPQNQWFGHYTFQNAANIPTGMIDRVEVLTGGDSAIYGSDAVAGVVNVVLKHQYQGDDLRLQAGGDTRGGEQFNDISWTGGKSGDKWHIVYNFEHSNRSPLWGKDRPGFDAVDDAGYGTWNPAARMFGYQYDVAGASAISLTNADGKYLAPPPGSCESFPYFRRSESKSVGTSGNQVTGPVTDNGTYCAQPEVFRNWVLSPGFRSNNGYVYGDYEINPNLSAYGSVALYTTTGISQTQRPFAYPMGGLPVPFYDQGTGQVITKYARQWTQLEMGTQGSTYDREKYWDIRVGLKGGFLDDQFNWNLELGSQKYLVHEDYTGLSEQGMFNFLFGPQLGTTTVDGTTYPIYDINQQRFWHPITPAEYSTFGVAGTNTAASKLQDLTFNVNGDLFKLPWDDKPVGWAAVLTADNQGFELSPDARGNTVDFGDPFQDLNIAQGTRQHYAFGTEFRVPILSTLTWDIAGRIDKYHDASIANIARTWHTGLEWRPLPGLLLRGSYGTNFRAPGMDAVYLQNSISTVGDYNDPLQCIQNHQASCPDFQHSTFFNQFSGGNPNLLPETGRDWTYGFVWDIPHVRGLSVQADYWRIELNNQINFIGLGTALTDEAGCLTGLQVGGAPYTAHTVGSEYCRLAIANVTRDAAGNIVAVHTGPINENYEARSGIDGAINYNLQTESAGAFNFSLHYTNYLTDYSRTLASDPLINHRADNVMTRMTATANWHRGPWDATLYGLRYGGVRANNYGGCETLANGIQPSLGDPQCAVYTDHIKPWVIWSAAVGYRFDKRVKMTLNINNIFDKIGFITPYAGGFQFISTLQGQSYSGRQIFLTIDYKLD
ncbi:MAG TPA: TonB-dependent receptor [Rhodanobacteraceae bacterium]|nr:TonB-dependent receptor [Rhodanobacteraceae bacterium]